MFDTHKNGLIYGYFPLIYISFNYPGLFHIATYMRHTKI